MLISVSDSILCSPVVGYHRPSGSEVCRNQDSIPTATPFSNISPWNISSPSLSFSSFLFLSLSFSLVLCVVLQVFDNRSAKCAALQKYLVMVVSGECER